MTISFYKVPTGFLCTLQSEKSGSKGRESPVSNAKRHAVEATSATGRKMVKLINVAFKVGNTRCLLKIVTSRNKLENTNFKILKKIKEQNIAYVVSSQICESIYL